MCSVYGAIVNRRDSDTESLIEATFAKARERGRDSWGLVATGPTGTADIGRSTDGHEPAIVELPPAPLPLCVVGSRRAEPTTEWVREKSNEDVQPFRSEGWIYCLNGTIANDRELLARLRGHPAYREPATEIDAAVIGVVLDCLGWEEGIRSLEGSFSVIACQPSRPDSLWIATNYKPVFVMSSRGGGLIQATSQAHFLPQPDSILEPSPVEIPPYSIGRLSSRGELDLETLYERRTGSKRVLAVCSGGLDSTVAAWDHHLRGDEVTLLHVEYGCQAGERERSAVEAVAARMGGEPAILQTDFFATAAKSVLTDPDGEIRSDRGGEAGAEFGHEWIPARNTVLLSLALAYAEANGFDTITLGTNLEESGGGYPDNEQEFINKVAHLVPYALRPYHEVEITQPVGTLMKHEIVELGHELEAPIEVTWSCYRGGSRHCGACGPCWMRQVAHLMHGLVDPVFADRWDTVEAKHSVRVAA